MKKIIIGIFMLLSLIGYYISFINTRSIYDFSLTLSPTQNTRNIMFLFGNDENIPYNKEQFTKVIIEICKENNTSIIKIDPIDLYNLNYYIYFNDKNLFQHSGLNFSKNQINTLNENKNFLLTNVSNKDADYYFPDFPGSINFYVYSIKNIKTMDGRYQFVGEKSKQAYLSLQKKFPSIQFELLSDEEITINQDLMNAQGMQSFIQLSIMLLVIAVVCMLMFYIQKEESISIKKMLGHSSLKILIKDNKKMIFEILIGSIIVYIICLFATIHNFNIFTILLLKYLLVFLLLELIMILLILVFIFYFFKRVAINNLLKHKSNFKGVLSLNLTLRIIIVVFGISIISTYFKPMLSDLKDAFTFSQYSNEINGYYKADNMQQFESDVSGYLHVLYDELNKSGGIAVEPAYYGELGNGHIPYLTVNKNYINSLRLKSIDRTEIKFHDNKNRVLIPKKYKSHASEFIAKELNNSNFEIIVIEDNQTVFTFDNSINESGLGYAKDPVIVVSDFVNPWFVYLKENQINKAKYDNELISRGYKASFDIYSVDESLKESFKMTFDRMIEEILLNSISFLSLCAVIAQYVLAYISSYKKSIAIKKAMGYSLIKRYDNMILIMSFFYFVVWSYCFIWGRPFIEQAIVLIMFVFECILSIIIIIKNERRITSVSLKE